MLSVPLYRRWLTRFLLRIKAPVQQQSNSRRRKYSSDTSVEKALLERRSVRSYKAEPLTIPEIAQILWAAQGITEPKKGMRTAPSARGMYLIEVYLVAGNVTNLPAGMYKYVPQGHELMKIAEGNVRDDLFKAAGQAQIKKRPCHTAHCR